MSSYYARNCTWLSREFHPCSFSIASPYRYLKISPIVDGTVPPSTGATHMITVNVGGTVYCTTKETLVKVDGSLLAELFDEEDASGLGGEKFIDRDGPCFRHVLNYLRSPAGLPTVLPADRSDREQLALEADFYGLLELLELLRPGGFAPAAAAASGGGGAAAFAAGSWSGAALCTHVVSQADLLECLRTTSRPDGLGWPALQLPCCDLRGVSLRYTKLAGSNLRGCNLAGVDATEADLTRADLRGANLAGARLRGACLNHAQLQDAHVGMAHIDNDTHVTCAQLQGANWSFPSNMKATAELTAQLAQWKDKWKAGGAVLA
jgi:hypothetical protein